MNYSDPDLLARLATDYVLGTMPPRSRRRFEKIALDSPAARRALRAAEEQLLPFAAQLPPRQPAERVWRAIEGRVQPAAREAQDTALQRQAMATTDALQRLSATLTGAAAPWSHSACSWRWG